MIGVAQALGGLLILATPADASVQGSVGAQSQALRHCFERVGADEGRARLRFVVGDDRRARGTRIVVLEPNDDRLRSCLVRVIEQVEFEAVAVGADVLYPVHLDRAEPDAGTRAEASAVRLSIAKTKPRIGHRWVIVDDAGRGISDLRLARLAKDAAVEADLSSSQTTRYVLMAVEGVTALAGLGVAGYSGYRLSNDLPDDPSRDLNIGLTAGGAVAGAVAGTLLLYHAWRAIDLVATRPVIHHLEYEQAQALVASANGAR